MVLKLPMKAGELLIGKNTDGHGQGTTSRPPGGGTTLFRTGINTIGRTIQTTFHVEKSQEGTRE